MAWLKPHLTEGRPVVYTETEGPSLTKQSDIEHSDIHAIMRKHAAGGLVDFQQREGRYGDFTQGADLLDAMLKVDQATEAFMELPSEVRDYFKNDPANLVDAVYDPARVDELERLGLLSEVAVSERAAAREAAAQAALEARRAEFLATAKELGVRIEEPPSGGK